MIFRFCIRDAITLSCPIRWAEFKGLLEQYEWDHHAMHYRCMFRFKEVGTWVRFLELCNEFCIKLHKESLLTIANFHKASVHAISKLLSDPQEVYGTYADVRKAKEFYFTSEWSA